MSNTSPTLFDIILGLADEIGTLEYGEATGGTTTTLVDSGLGDSDDDWNTATAFITYDSGGASAAPEGEFSEVTDYTASSGTMATVWTVAPASGDLYALAAGWTLDEMIGSVNRALVRMGPVPNTDTSLSTAANQTEYTVPAAARYGLRRVYMDQYTQTSDTRPQEISNWRQDPDGILYLPVQPPTGNTLTLVYMAPHAAMNAYDDALSKFIPLRRMIAEATVQAFRSRVRQGDDNAMERNLNDAAVELEAVKKMLPIWDPGTPFKPIMKGRRSTDRRARRHKNKYGNWYLGS